MRLRRHGLVDDRCARPVRDRQQREALFLQDHEAVRQAKAGLSAGVDSEVAIQVRAGEHQKARRRGVRLGVALQRIGRAAGMQGDQQLAGFALPAFDDAGATMRLQHA
jgi:hypothetical protein